MMFSLLGACVSAWPEDQYDLTFSEEDLKIGFVYSAPINDGGWAQTHHEGAAQIADDLDAVLEFVPAVSNLDAPGAIDDLVDGGANVVYTTSSGYIGATLDAASRHPDTFFFSCCGQVSAANVTSYFARMYQPLYLAGYAAAAKTCTGQLGVVAALPNPQFIRHINAFAMGAQRRAAEDGRSIAVQVEFVGAFYDPAVEEAITLRHIDRGVDVILAQSNSIAPVAAGADETVTCDTEEVPVRRIAYHSSTGCDTAGNTENCLGAAHWNWGPLYAKQLADLFEGSFEPTAVGWQPMSDSNDSTVDFTPGAVVNTDQVLVSELSQIRTETVANPQFPFVGPIQDSTGSTVISAGQQLTDQDLDRICWFHDAVEIYDATGASVPLGTISSLCEN